MHVDMLLGKFECKFRNDFHKNIFYAYLFDPKVKAFASLLQKHKGNAKIQKTTSRLKI